MNGTKIDNLSTDSQNIQLSIVTSARCEGYLKKIRIAPSNQLLSLPSSACVSRSDRIRYDKKSASVICKNGDVKFFPPYIVKEKILIGNLNLDFLIKEITSQEEFDGYRALADLHYRGHALRGRTARLIVRSFNFECPQVIGYLELTSSFYMNKARAKIIDAPFKSGDISWERWDIPTQKKYINLFVRIARVVVCPEFRGLGISQLLIRHATEYAKTRWHVAGYKPYFLEISADMLKFVPFAEKADMKFVGVTEGNIARVAKDMKYLINRFVTSENDTTKFEDSCGICDQQITRMKNAVNVMKNTGMDIENLTKKLANLPKQDILRDYALFHNIVSFPKPHYMLGLNDDASQFLTQRLKDVAPNNEFTYAKIKILPINSSIFFKSLSISYHSHVRRTRSTHAIQQAFGISPDTIHLDVIRDLSIEVNPGEILLIVGPSGSGKTSILEPLIRKPKTNPDIQIDGSIIIPEDAKIGTFESINSNKPLIEYLSGKNTLKGLYFMNLAGLSEAFLYLKRFKELSKGQQYRAMLAQLIASQSNVWVADEFCSNLDNVTANIVANNLQKISRGLEATVILATPNCSGFIHSLKPDKVLSLSNVGTYSIHTGKEYCRMLNMKKNGKDSFLFMKVSQESYSSIQGKIKKSIIQIGHKKNFNDALFFECNGDILPVKITNVDHKHFCDLNDEDAIIEGFENLTELQNDLKLKYPNVKLNSYMTIIKFEYLCGEG
jgi:ABC-type ATPase with predicted acetyltransferase domain